MKTLTIFNSASRGYRDVIKNQFEYIIRKIKDDIASAIRSGKYMEYKIRCFISDMIKDLSEYTSSSYASGFENELLKLRRLEDFDNKIIEINMTGNKYPIDAILEWKGGKNYLELSANVLFIIDESIPQSEISTRK